MSLRKRFPISPLPNQLIQSVVNGQAVVIAIRQIGSSLFTTTEVDGEVVARTVRATHGGCITPWPNAAVKTPICWEDSDGCDAPQYEGLGARWNLVFDDENDGE